MLIRHIVTKFDTWKIREEEKSSRGKKQLEEAQQPFIVRLGPVSRQHPL